MFIYLFGLKLATKQYICLINMFKYILRITKIKYFKKVFVTIKSVRVLFIGVCNFYKTIYNKIRFFHIR